MRPDSVFARTRSSFFTHTVPLIDVDPDSAPDYVVSFRHEYLPLILGALLQLTQRAAWASEDFDTVSAQLERIYRLIDLFIAPSVEAQQPFYDTPNNASLEVDAAYPWYEAAGDWVIAGFLATTFTPGAAIVYNMTIPRARVALRQHDLGAAFRILINGVEVANGTTQATNVGTLEVPVDATTVSPNPPWRMSVEMVSAA